jgi:formylglycine-generating enzyme
MQTDTAKVLGFGGGMIGRVIGGTILIVLCGLAEVATAAETFRDCSICPTLVKLPRGTFRMGTAPEKTGTDVQTGEKANTDVQKDDSSDSDAAEDRDSNDEHPQHSVTFEKPFALGKYPVTRGEFAVFVKETGHDSPACFMGGLENVADVVLPRGLSWRNPGFAQTERDPAVCVTFDDAKRYAGWLSRKTGKPYRLPTEAEWEYAARAGTTTPRYWTGEDAVACRFANVLDQAAAKAFNLDKDSKDAFYPCRDGYIYTAPSGSFPPNAFGLYDMLGNVWQWVADCYTVNYKEALADGSGSKNPDDECGTRVLRGGSWATPIEDVRSAYRHGDGPNTRTIIIGFRVARSL